MVYFVSWFHQLIQDNLSLQLVKNLSTILTSNRCSTESVTVIGILSLILNHTANGVLHESVKILLLSTSWVPAVKKLVDATCSRNQKDSDIDEGSIETLLLMLLLQHFSLKRLVVFTFQMNEMIHSIRPKLYKTLCMDNIYLY